MLSVEKKSINSVIESHKKTPHDLFFIALTCHQVALQDLLFDDVIGHQLGTVYNGVTGNIRQATWKTVQYLKHICTKVA